jgi:Flp pilus assembly protein TadD
LDTLGQAQLAAGTVDQALGTLREAVKLGPNSAEIRLHLAQALAKSGQTAEARTELQTAIRLHPPMAQRKEAVELLGAKP